MPAIIFPPVTKCIVFHVGRKNPLQSTGAAGVSRILHRLSFALALCVYRRGPAHMDELVRARAEPGVHFDTYIEGRGRHFAGRALGGWLSLQFILEPLAHRPVPVWTAVEPGPPLTYISGYDTGPPGPPLRAAAAVLVEAGTGAILYAHNEHERRPMASTTKIMTALDGPGDDAAGGDGHRQRPSRASRRAPTRDCDPARS